MECQLKNMLQKQKSKKKKDLKRLPKLLPWETKYQHTIFDFFKTNENLLKIEKFGDKHKEFSFNDIDKVSKYASQNTNGNFSNLQESFNSSSSKLENDDFIQKCEDIQMQFHCCNDGFGISSKDDCFDFTNCNSICLEKFSHLNYSLYDLPYEMKRSIHNNIQLEKTFSSRRNPFEIGSSRYRGKDLDKLFSFPVNFPIPRHTVS